METLRQDVRYAFRRLIQKPGFTMLLVLVLAPGIAANTALFSVVKSVLLAPLPYDAPDRLVVVKEINPGRTIEPNSVSPGNFLDLHRQNSLFESVAAWYKTASTLQGEHDAEQVASAQVSPDFFAVLRTKPSLGRVFLPEETAGVAFEVSRFVSGDRLVVISDELWRRRFRSDPSIVGKKITINRHDWEVIGVMPAGFAATGSDTELWLPWDIAGTYNSSRFPNGVPRDWRFMNVLGRLRAGVSSKEADTRLTALYDGLAERYPETNKGWRARANPLHEEVVGSSRRVLLVMFGAVAVVLLLACANVAGLVLAHTISRQHEFALRLALGASRKRLIRQLFTESLIIALASGLLGIGLAWIALNLLLSFAPADTPRISEVTLDPGVLLFTFLLSLITAVAFGLIPALRSTGSDLAGKLISGGTKGMTGVASTRRFRNAMVIGEIAIALVLVTCATLFARSFVRLLSVNPGFDSHNLLTMHINLDSATYDRRAAEYYRQLTERIAAHPSVVSAAAVTTLPMSDVGADFTRPYWREGEAEPRGDGDKVAIRMATPGYFKTMGIPLLQGRNFDHNDRRDTVAVMIISKSFAERVWPNQNPVGKRLMLDYNRGKYPYEVIGVTGEIKYYGLRSVPRPEVFIPHAQNAYLPMNLVVRTTIDPRTVVEEIKREVRALDPTQPVSNITTMEQLVSRSIATDRFSMWLFTFLGTLALGLACTGLFSLLSYLVSQRSHELGVRIALGAQRRDIFKLILGQGVFLVLIGVTIGMVASLGCARLLSSLLFGVSANDPLTFVSTPALLVLAAFLASYLPAWRATTVDPLVVLKSE